MNEQDNGRRLPRGWCWATVGDLIEEIQAGKSFRCDERPPGDGEWGVVKVSAVTWGTFDEIQSKTCTDVRLANPAFLIHPGDFLFSRANTIDLVGACVIAGQLTKKLMLSDKILRLRLAHGWDRWLLWALRSRQGRDEIERLATGNQESMRNIGQERIRQIRIPLAPLPEQRRIVEAVEDHFSRLDDAVATLERVQRNLERYRASVLKAAVEGRLVPTEAELALAEGAAQPNVNALLDSRSGAKTRRGVPESVDAGAVARRVMVPCGWALRSVAELLRRSVIIDLKDGNHGSNHPRKGELSEQGVPFITAAQVQDFSIDYEGAPHIQGPALDRLRVGFAEPGDVILTHKGSVGRVAVAKRYCVLTPQTTYYRVDRDIIDPGYLAIHHASQVFFEQLAEQKSQTTRDFVPISDQYRLFILIPPIREQHRIADVTQARLATARYLEGLVHTSIVRSRDLRQSILRWAFEGKLVDQDPNDEPASALLARIRAECAEATTTNGSRRRVRGASL